MTEERIKALIIQYDDSVRYRKQLLDFNFAEKLLSVILPCMGNKQILEEQLDKKIDECQRLKKYLEKSQDRVSKLYSDNEKNTHLKEFLDFAVFLTTFRDSNENQEISAAVDSIDDDELLRRYDISLEDFGAEESIDDDGDELNTLKLQFDEITDKCKRLEISLNEAQEDITKLNSRLKQVESERDSLINLSEKLGSLMFRYEQIVCHHEINETNARVDNSSEIEASNSNLIPAIDNSSMEIDFNDNSNNELSNRMILSKQSFHCANCSKSFKLNDDRQTVIECPTCDKRFGIKITTDTNSVAERSNVLNLANCSLRKSNSRREAELDKNQNPSKCSFCDQNSNHESLRCLHSDEQCI